MDLDPTKAGVNITTDSAPDIEDDVDPDDLLGFINKIDFTTCVISTPDRDTLDNELGPPRNRSHLREWSFPEFESYIAEHFRVMEHFHCREPGYKSQLIVFSKDKQGT